MPPYRSSTRNLAHGVLAFSGMTAAYWAFGTPGDKPSPTLRLVDTFNFKEIKSAVVYLFNRNSTKLLVTLENSPFTPEKSFGFPGGGVELAADASTEDTLRREFLEETGTALPGDIDLSDPEQCLRFTWTKPHSPRKTAIYVMRTDLPVIYNPEAVLRVMGTPETSWAGFVDVTKVHRTLRSHLFIQETHKRWHLHRFRPDTLDSTDAILGVLIESGWFDNGTADRMRLYTSAKNKYTRLVRQSDE